MLTQARVRELFDYREDGALVWRVVKGARAKIGDVAGSTDSHGYVQVRIDKKLYHAHRVVFLYHHGYLPENHVDHIDRRRWNNRVGNLREVSHTCNLRNTGNPSTNTSGVKGVCWFSPGGKWLVQIKVAGKTRFLGHFSDFTEAVAHRLAAEQFLNWEGCDSCSPAFQYMQDYLKGIVLPASPEPRTEGLACLLPTPL